MTLDNDDANENDDDDTLVMTRALKNLGGHSICLQMLNI